MLKWKMMSIFLYVFYLKIKKFYKVKRVSFGLSNPSLP